MKKLMSILLSIILVSSIFVVPFSAYADTVFYYDWCEKSTSVDFTNSYAFTEMCDSSDEILGQYLNRCQPFNVELPVDGTVTISVNSAEKYYSNDRYYIFDYNSKSFIDRFDIEWDDYDSNSDTKKYEEQKNFKLSKGSYYIVREYSGNFDAYEDDYNITFSFSCLKHSYNTIGKVTKAATYTATGVKTYTCSVCGQNKNETIAKLPKVSNTASIKAKTATVKYSKLRKKNQTVARKNAIVVSKAKGTVTYKKVSGNKKITINKKTGKITLKKGLKKGTYKLKVKVTASGTSKYKKAVKTVTVKIKVK